uniref:Uncharacterized protein n=1 Tax=uncultured Helicobacter sp. TaxID=175537 RepID=A0A650ELN2_9HELI|nr:hypothetical protein Helico5904_0140 [uncultured Helicobacter sp.]
MNPKEDDPCAIAKRAVKISIACILFMLLLSLINIYILINQVSATAAMSKEIKVLQAHIGESAESTDSQRILPSE